MSTSCWAKSSSARGLFIFIIHECSVIKNELGLVHTNQLSRSIPWSLLELIFFHVFRYPFFFLHYGFGISVPLHGEKQGCLMTDPRELLGLPSNQLPWREGISSLEWLVWTQFPTGLGPHGPRQTAFPVLHLTPVLTSGTPCGGGFSVLVTNRSHASFTTCKHSEGAGACGGAARRALHPIVLLCTFRGEGSPCFTRSVRLAPAAPGGNRGVCPKTSVQRGAWKDFTPHFVNLPSQLRPWLKRFYSEKFSLILTVPGMCYSHDFIAPYNVCWYVSMALIIFWMWIFT